MNISQLIVRFERDWPERSYAGLGQLCMLGVMNSLLKGYDCKRPVEFVPAYATPAGQIKMGKVLQGDGDTAASIEAFTKWVPPPFWALPQEGWRTARCLQASLNTDLVGAEGITDLLCLLTGEVEDWLSVMEKAVRADIRFQLGINTCPDPPDSVITFTRKQYAETAEGIEEALEASGLIDEE